jgi:hypothetical protein
LAGISRSDIMKMGRWKSDAVDRYFSSTSSSQNLLLLSRQLHSQPGPSISTADSLNNPYHFPTHSNHSYGQQRRNR